VSWLALLTGGPASSVTPVDAGTSSLVSYILGFGPLGVFALAMVWLLFRGWHLVSPDVEAGIRRDARDQGRADLERENARLITERDEALKTAQALVPLLATFTSTTTALIPLLQELVRRQEGRGSG
jgi:hypothetical protein